MAAAAQSSGDMAAQALVDAGVDILCADAAGNTPAHIACQQGREEVLAILLAKGPAGPVVRASNHLAEVRGDMTRGGRLGKICSIL